MAKPFTVDFKIDAKIIAILYMCWKYKYPISYFLSFYENFGAQTLLIFKALACNKKITLNDNAFTNLIEESKKLHNQIIKGISTNLKIKQLENLVRAGKFIDEDIPETPMIEVNEFTEEFADFVKNYMLKNIEDIFKETVTLKLGTRELYQAVR